MRFSSFACAQRVLVSGFVVLFSQSCASTKGSSSTQLQNAELKEFREATAEESPAFSSKRLNEIEKEIIETNESLAEKSPKTARVNHIPSEINDKVRKWIHFFSVKDRERFQRFLNRGEGYRALIEKILEEEKVPLDLYYLAMIESGFIIQARSHASAVGPWQFIPATGTRYGLTQNYYVDERQDIVRSTRAAAKYLKNLHTAFQSWYLAMASYNAGEGRILGAVLRGGTRDFWNLVERKALPAETRNYVPKFLAARIIGMHPEKYGFKIKRENTFEDVESVDVPSSVALTEIANRTSISADTLKALNPHLLRGITPTHVSQYAIWIPKGKAHLVASMEGAFEKTRSMMPAERVAAQSASPARSYHLVRRGENLGKIARKYGVTVVQLKAANGLRSNTVPAGKKLKVTFAKSTQPVRYYRVKRGDQLTQIANRHKTSVSKIKKLNHLDSHKIFVGQRLKVSTGI